jgi:hypothetical protein
MVLLFLIVEEIFKKQIYCCESKLNKQKIIQTSRNFVGISLEHYQKGKIA